MNNLTQKQREAKRERAAEILVFVFMAVFMFMAAAFIIHFVLELEEYWR